MKDSKGDKISDSIIKRGDLYIHLNVTDIDKYKKNLIL